ncbi:MAG: hypothetical protein DRM97_04480 [Thermoprotei archaeon]|nr:MAG: hypothetical protein DRM97_04480 [Thermoprotei archaeon]
MERMSMVKQPLRKLVLMPDEHIPLTRLALLFTVAFLCGVSMRLSIPFLAFSSREEFQTSMLIVSLLTVGFFSLRAVMSMIAGYLAEQKGMLVVLVVPATILNAVALALYIPLHSPALFIALRAIQGALSGLTWPLVQLVVACLVPSYLRGRTLSLYFAMGSLGLYLGDFLYYLVHDMGFEVGLALSSLIYLASVPLMYWGMRGGLPYAQEKSEDSVDEENVVDHDLKIVHCVAILGLVNNMIIGICTGSVIYVFMREALGIGRGDVALVLALAQLLALIMSYITAWIADLFTEKMVFIVLAIIGMNIPILLSAGEVTLVLLALAAASLVQKSLIPLTRRAATTYTRRRAMAVAEVNAAMNIGVCAGQLLFATLYDYVGLATVSLTNAKLLLVPLSFELLSLPYAITLVALLRAMRKSITQ